MKTFYRYFDHFPRFVQGILSWKPDYIVPVAKKGCKLLKASNQVFGPAQQLIRYRSFFELTNAPTVRSKIAVVDDATQFTSTILEYRRYFENQGAIVRTFSFVGHQSLFTGEFEKYDDSAEIYHFLPGPVYQEYILQQSYYLLENQSQFDLDHIVFELPLDQSQFKHLLSISKKYGYLLWIQDGFGGSNIRRFSLDKVVWPDRMTYLESKSISSGAIAKIKCLYNEDTKRLYFSPLVFPTWNFRETPLPAGFFSRVPLKLPFDVTRPVDQRNRGSILRAYYNIYLTYAAELAACYLDSLRSGGLDIERFSIRETDLEAILGTEKSSAYCQSVKELVSVRSPNSTSVNWTGKQHAVEDARFSDISAVVDYLRDGYRTKCRRSNTRVGVHFDVGYDYLFENYYDSLELSENLDFLCDLGILVPETIVRRGRVFRGCRSGEPTEREWERTGLIIAMAIEQIQERSSKKGHSVKAMHLMKVLANFSFDYPAESFRELHCLYPSPYTFGSLMRVFHPLRARNNPSIYKRMWPYFEYNKKRRGFVIRSRSLLVKKIKEYFDERQEVDYSTITTYLHFMTAVLAHSGNVDNLNMLSLCREQQHFFSHVCYNIKEWYELYCLYLSSDDRSKALECLHDSGEQVNSCLEKLSLYDGFTGRFDGISRTFGNSMEFIKTWQRVQHNCQEFEDSMKYAIAEVKRITALQVSLTNMSLYAETGVDQYLHKVNVEDCNKCLAAQNVSVTLSLDVIKPDSRAYQLTKDAVFREITNSIDSLPAERPMLEARLRMEGIERAKNIATHIVYRDRLAEANILFIDFTGLRDLPEPKEDAISLYYTIVEKNIRKRGGTKLYGGRGGDDAFAVLFGSIKPALECGFDIKRDFSQDLFLHGRGDVKQGIDRVRFDSEEKEKSLISCWGQAKDCCEFKSETFRNRGFLLVSERLINGLRDEGDARTVGLFEKVPGAYMKDSARSPVYRYKLIDELPRKTD